MICGILFITFTVTIQAYETVAQNVTTTNAQETTTATSDPSNNTLGESTLKNISVNVTVATDNQVNQNKTGPPMYQQNNPQTENVRQVKQVSPVEEATAGLKEAIGGFRRSFDGVGKSVSNGVNEVSENLFSFGRKAPEQLANFFG